MEARLELLTIQVSTNEDQGVYALGAHRPRALQLAVEHHVHPVEHVATRLTLDRNDSLHSEDVGTATLEQIGQPIIELGGIDRSRIGQTNGRDLFVVMM